MSAGTVTADVSPLAATSWLRTHSLAVAATCQSPASSPVMAAASQVGVDNQELDAGAVALTNAAEETLGLSESCQRMCSRQAGTTSTAIIYQHGGGGRQRCGLARRRSRVMRPSPAPQPQRTRAWEQ
jgi:hypothetical protein